MTESEVSNIITASLSADGEIYIDSDVTLGVRSVNDRELNRYILKYSVGEEVGAGTTMGYNTAEARYQATHRVTDNDYELEAVIFNIILEEKVNDKILAEFSLTNEEYWLGESRYLQNTRAISGENYGEISVYVDGEEIDYENVSIVNGQNVEVRVRLNYGYTLRGYRQNVADIVVLSQIPTNTETTILTINNFNAEENGDGGIYSIYISKDVYTASLTVEEGTLGNYSITSTSSRRTQSGNTTTLDNIYIGKSIIFNNDPIANEKLENYYYLNRAGEEVEISLGENGAVIVTEELLRAIEGEEIRFGVNTSKLYMLSIEDRSNGLIESIETSLAIKYEDGSPIYYEPSVSITVDMRSIAG